jgi:hypothetical protein
MPLARLLFVKTKQLLTKKFLCKWIVRSVFQRTKYFKCVYIQRYEGPCSICPAAALRSIRSWKLQYSSLFAKDNADKLRGFLGICIEATVGILPLLRGRACQLTCDIVDRMTNGDNWKCWWSMFAVERRKHLNSISSHNLQPGNAIESKIS